MLACLEAPLGYNIFNEIEVRFRLIGHTHKGIDQGFRKASDYLHSKDTLSFFVFYTVFRKTLFCRMEVIHMKTIIT